MHLSWGGEIQDLFFGEEIGPENTLILENLLLLPRFMVCNMLSELFVINHKGHLIFRETGEVG